MIVAMDLDRRGAGRATSKTGLNASSEWRFHRDIFRARPDVAAVVHAHAPYATVLSMLRRPIPASHYMIAAFGAERDRMHRLRALRHPELSELAVAGLGPRQGVLLGSHGMIAVGPDLKRALWLAGELETLAKLHYLASLAGGPVILPNAEDPVAVREILGLWPRREKNITNSEQFPPGFVSCSNTTQARAELISRHCDSAVVVLRWYHPHVPDGVQFMERFFPEMPRADV